MKTFDEAAAAYIAQHRHGWSNPVHAAMAGDHQGDASPIVGKMNVADIPTAHVMKVLEPIWATKTQTAKKLRAGNEKVLGWATTSGYRTGDNPARWKGHLENLLAKPSMVHKTKHMPALPYADMPAFMAELRARTTGMTALALEFSVLNRGAGPADIRNAKRETSSPSEYGTFQEFSKTGKPHRVPLSDAALAVIQKARKIAVEIGGDVAKSRSCFRAKRAQRSAKTR